MPPMDIASDAAQLNIHNHDDGELVRFTVEGAPAPALLLYRISTATSSPLYRARWLVEPKLLPAQVALNIATAVGLYVIDQNRPAR